MSTASRARLAEAIVTALDGAVAAGTPADALRRQLAGLSGDDPGTRLHLIEHRESYDGSTSYDVIVRGAGNALSIGVAGSPGLPWPMRGLVRANEQHVVRVNGRMLWFEEVVNLLDEAFEDVRMSRHMIDSALIDEELDAHPIELTDDEVQRAVDAYRRAQGLYGAERTRAWLAARNLTTEAFTALAERTERLARLRHRVAGAEVDRVFAAAPDRYSTLLIAWSECPAAQGECLAAQGQWGGDPSAGLGVDPLAVIAAGHADGRAGGVGSWTHCDLPPGAEDLADAGIGHPVRIRMDGADAVGVVLARRPARLDAATRDRIERELFEAWLDERRRAADVAWYWGQAWQTDGAA